MRRYLLPLALAALAMAAPAGPPGDRIVSQLPFIAEGLAIGPGGKLLVSAVYAKTVLIERGQGFGNWLKPGRLAPLGGLFGMAADPARHRLWIAEVAGAEVPGDGGKRRTAILEVELGSGRVVARHAIDDDGHDRWLGDVTLAKNGSLYASDSKSGGIYRLKPGGRPERIAQLPSASLQGLTETTDGTGLLVSDYATGLHRIDLATGADVLLDAGTAQLKGIDGLTRDGTSLIATQNGTVPNRVLRIRLDPGERTIAGVDILARDPARYDDISLGTIVAGRFVFVAHSQWSATAADGSLTTAPKPARLASLPLR